jgi:hypothetical protein
VKFLATLPAIPALGLMTRYSAADEFVEINGWILKRSDLGRRGGK